MSYIPLKERLKLCMTYYFNGGSWWFHAPSLYKYERVYVDATVREALERILELESELEHLTNLTNQ